MTDGIREYGETVAVLRARQAVYAFLATVFFEEPTIALLEGMRDRSADLEGSLGEFAASLAGVDLGILRTDLAAEYARLFLNMGPRPISPYESVYTSELHLLMQEARDKVLAMYRAERIVVATEVRIPEDHVALEFDFMGKMCQKAVAALENDDEAEADRCLDVQAAFVHDHLGAWVPALCCDVRATTAQPFWLAIADFTERFIEDEGAFFAEGHPGFSVG